LDYPNPKALNTQFEVIKKRLSEYLKNLEIEQIDIYSNFFQQINSDKTLVLNFNYTSSVKNYMLTNKGAKIIPIHGELDNEDNPMIFGFAADNNESRDLINNGDNEFVKNIKKHNYKRTRNEGELRKYLDSTPNIDISILGHSCGISDKLILKQIFNHDNISSIRVYYHEKYENFRDIEINIDRIMNDDEKFHKVINYLDCPRMPQKDDNPKLKEEFKQYINELVLNQKTHRDKERGTVVNARL
jgi:hypothetical protein